MLYILVCCLVLGSSRCANPDIIYFIVVCSRFCCNMHKAVRLYTVLYFLPSL